MASYHYVKPFKVRSELRDIARGKAHGGYYFANNGNGIRVGDITVGVTCHVATYIWLSRAKYEGEFPDRELITYAQAFVNRLMRFGNPPRPASPSAAVMAKWEARGHTASRNSWRGPTGCGTSGCQAVPGLEASRLRLRSRRAMG